MKSKKLPYQPEELALVLLFTVFFIGIFIGSFAYRPGARFFPLVMSIPGTVMILLYLFRWIFPPKIRMIMEGENEFAVGARDKKEIGQKTALAGEPDSADEPGVSPRMRGYLITLFSVLYILLAYLFGFYIATAAGLSAYLYYCGRRSRRFMWGNIILAGMLLGVVYVFDTAFGHHFGLGVLIE